MPERLPALRKALTAWADTRGIAAEQVEVLTWATYEALANVAAHAYGNRLGWLDLHATRLPDPDRVVVTVTDQGHWRPAAPPTTDRQGGLGLVLIHELADRVDFDTRGQGTTVRMVWHVRPAGEC